MSKKIKPASIDVIVTEPYLGPARGQRNPQLLVKVARELEQLYHEAVLQFEKVLKSGGRVVMVWPVFVMAGQREAYLNTKNILKNSSFQKVNILEKFKSKVIRLTDRATLLYGRPGQKVWRELVILQKH